MGAHAVCVKHVEEGLPSKSISLDKGIQVGHKVKSEQQASFTPVQRSQLNKVSWRCQRSSAQQANACSCQRKSQKYFKTSPRCMNFAGKLHIVQLDCQKERLHFNQLITLQLLVLSRQIISNVDQIMYKIDLIDCCWHHWKSRLIRLMCNLLCRPHPRSQA